MSDGQSGPTLRAGKFNAILQVFDANDTPSKVYIVNAESQSLTNTAAEPEEETNEQPIPKITG